MKKLSFEEMEVVNACGSKRALNCINDAYTGHGWLSFGLAVASAVDPGIAVSVAAGCGIAGLLWD